MEKLMLFGGPVAFMLIAIWGVSSLIGPLQPAHPLDRLREGEVVAGMSELEVTDRLGQPKAVIENEDGSTILRYSRMVWDTKRNTFLVEDGDVRISADGTVSGVSFTSVTPPPS